MLTLRRRFDDERGVTLVLMALLMVAMLGIAGLVVNIGLVRADRQRNKSVSDVGVTAGLQALNYNGYVGTFRGACAALDYIKANHAELSSLSLTSGWTDGSGTAISGGDPCDSTPTAAYTARYNQICNYSSSTTARSSFAWFSGNSPDGTITVTVKAGYAASDMTSDGFADDSYHSDTGDATRYGCDQLAVTIQEREPAGFGKVLGAGTLSSRIRSVGRVEVGGDPQSAIALLLLERTGCGAVDINGGSSVHVLGTGTLPGIVHADSYGTAGSSGNCNSLHVLEGDFSNGIVAERAPSGSPAKPGIVSTAAMSGSPGIAANAYDDVVNVVAEDSAPTGHAPIGRGPVDTSYRAAIATLWSDADTKTRWTTSAATAAGYQVTNCNPSAADLAFAKLFIDCTRSAGFTNATTFPANVTDVVFNGKVNMGSDLRFVSPANVYVYGDSTGGTPQGVSIGSGATLSVNKGSALTCTNRTSTTPNATTKFVLMHGQLNMSGGANLEMCSTTLLLGDGSIPTTNGTLPANNGYTGPLSMSGGSAIDWTAPNTNSTGRATAAQLANLEDLAFWTESSTASNVNGSGSSMTLKGVFFAPNADPFRINAGSGTITADAQFITRKLEVSGGGTLNMRANPDDVVLTPYVNGFSLVR